MTKGRTNIAHAQPASVKFAEVTVGTPTRLRLSRLLDSAIFFALLALLALTAVPLGTAQPWWEATFECAVFALTALWIIDGLLSGTWCVGEHRLLIPLLALIAFAFVQTLPLWSAEVRLGVVGGAQRTLSADPYETRLFALRLLALTLSAALLLRYTSSRRRLRMLINVIVGLAVASALFGILRMMTQTDLWGISLNVPLSRTWGGVNLSLAADEGYGQFLNRNHFAFLMEMAFGLMLGLVIGRGVRRSYLLIYLAATVPVWVALVLTNSRGGVFSMIAQLVFVVLLLNVARPRQAVTKRTGRITSRWRRHIGGSLIVRAALIACLVTAVTAGAIWIGGDPLVSRLESLPKQLSGEESDDRRGMRRIEIWDATWQLIKAHPLTGVGFGGYRTAVSNHHDALGTWTPQQAHNDYLELLASGGLVGLALGAWFVIGFLRCARERLRSSDSFRRAACYGALAGVFGIAVHSLVDFGLHITVNALVLMALVTIAAVDGRVEKKTPASGNVHHHEHSFAETV